MPRFRLRTRCYAKLTPKDFDRFRLLRKKKSTESDSDENDEKFVTPAKRIAKSISNEKIVSQSSSDDDIVQSSQNIRRSKLRKKLIKNSLRKSRTPNRSPKKLKIDSCSGEGRKISLSDGYNIDPNELKEETTTMINNIDNCETFEMVHDLSGLLAAGTPSSNILESPVIGHSINIDALTDNENEVEKQGDQDPLDIDIESKNNKKSPSPKKYITEYKFNKQSPLLYEGTDYSSENESKEENEEELPKELLQKLVKLNIQLEHEVPPQHLHCGLGLLTKEEIQEFESHGPLKRGLYSKAEDDTIKRNWKNFCKIHEWDEKNPKPFILVIRKDGKYYISSYTQRLRFVQFLAYELPWRSLYSVNKRFKNLFNDSVNKGKFTSKEDEKIIEYVKKNSSNENQNVFSELAKILKRNRKAIWARYQVLKKLHNLKDEIHNIRKANKSKIAKDPKKKKKVHERISANVKWTAELVNKFISTLLEISSHADFKDLEYQLIEESTWSKMEEVMKISCKVLKKFWYFQLHMQLFCPEPVHLQEVKIKLIDFVYANEYTSLEDVEWEQICTILTGTTTQFLSKLYQQLIDYAKIHIKSSDFKAASEYLYNIHLADLKIDSTDAILPKLDYIDGKIICVDKGTENIMPRKTTTDPLQDEEKRNKTLRRLKRSSD